jgi:hypothetical protein
MTGGPVLRVRGQVCPLTLLSECVYDLEVRGKRERFAEAVFSFTKGK